MSYTTSALIMLIAGIGVPILASLNASLGKFLTSPIVAVTVLLFVAFASISIILLASLLLSGTQIYTIQNIILAPHHYFIAGLLMVFYILSITTIAPNFGVGNAVFFVLLGQLISAAVIDHFGLFGANSTALSSTRTLGLGVMALGIWVTQQA